MNFKERFPIMSSSTSAQEIKATEGQTLPQSRAGSSAGGSTVLGFSENIGERVAGEPLLTRSIKGKVIDVWSRVMNGAESAILEKIVSMSINDDAYSMVHFIRSIEYQGFDRLFYIKHGLTKMSVSTFAQFAVIGAIRGSNFTKIAETCENMPTNLISAFQTCGFVKTPKKRTDFTILRNTASIPHWCAYWCKKAEIVKKIPTSTCPAEIQFPGAASLPMSRNVRFQHIQFCAEFSQLLPGGRFNLNIYLTAMKNAIPVTDIPQEILATLQIGSMSENYILTEQDTQPYTQAMVRVR